jgi:UDP-GlcNAc:undecaprenyl-phosphate GlcNAc-1-phosphate transferase
MESLILVMGMSIMLCLAIVPPVRSLALRWGLVDRPDGRRKMHGRTVPLAGGVAVFASVGLVLAAALLLPHPLQGALLQQKRLLFGLFVASAVILAVGVADDFGRLRGRHKLVGQIVAVLIVMQFGVHVQRLQLFGWTIELGVLAGPFTCFLLLGTINSINLIDGMDGLLGSLGVWLSLTLACLAGLGGQWWAMLLALALAGALLGFLRFNLPPASIFMGDAGSMLVGLMLGTLAIQTSLAAPNTLAILLPLGLLTLPFLDTTAAIVRRKLTGRSIYTTDRGHLHHCLLRRGLSTHMVLVVVALCCLVTGGGVLAAYALENELIVLFAVGSVVVTLVWTRMFGFAEVMLIRERGLNRLQPAEPARQMEVRLQGSRDWRVLWNLLTEVAQRLDLQEMLLDVNAPALHEGYHARWDRAAVSDEVPLLWRVTIPLVARGQAIGRLEIAGQPDHVPLWSKIAALARVVDAYTDERVPLMAQPAAPVALRAADRQIAVEAYSLN